MLQQTQSLYNPTLKTTLQNITALSLRAYAERQGIAIAEQCAYGGHRRMDMWLIQQEDVSTEQIDTLNIEALVCTFKLGHRLLCKISQPSLNLQRLEWQLIYPTAIADNEDSDSYLWDSSYFRIISDDFDDQLSAVIEQAILEMSS